MDLSTIPIVAVAISIIICWALFAILCSLAHEALVQVKAERGRFMRKYLLNQLQDFSNDINWGSLFYMHGTIDLLSRDAGEPPADINSRLFAETLIDVVGSSGIVQMKKEAMKETPYKHDLLNNFKVATAVLIQSDVISFLTQALKSAEQSASAGNNESENSEDKIYDKLVVNIETWYNDLIKRLGGWYKKKTRARLFWLGLILGLLLNIDSIQLFNHFNTNPESRKIVMQFYEKNADSLASKAQSPAADPVSRTLIKKQIEEYSKTLDSLAKKADLPVGFDQNIFSVKPTKPPGRFFIFKILGLLITGLAASFGAPFWFDVLRKAYSVKKV